MSISPEQAADALRDIADIEHRSRELASYRNGAPILFLWGVISILGYGAMGIAPRYGIVWWPLAVLGTVVTTLFVRRTRRGAEPAARLGQRVFLMWGVMLLLCFSTFALLNPKIPAQLTPFPGLVVGASYMLMGIWVGKRYAVLGSAIFASALIGAYVLNWYRETVSSGWPGGYFSFWMAGVMGTGLILGGLWLRKA